MRPIGTIIREGSGDPRITQFGFGALIMRLTLRTLLAYLDDVLDPADKEELAQKIESSDFAEDLVHRTRDTVRRLRLSAPQLIGTGMGLDPNSVAEYLDNVMPPDAVGDYERICLESDVHLAEAAACHHVLTMILGQPADVDPLARQRMYTIASEAGNRKRLRMESAHTMAARAVAATAPAVSMAGPAVVQQPRAIEIPEYLRTGRWWRSWPALVGLAAVLIVGIAIFLAAGSHGWLAGNPSAAAISPEATALPTDNAAPSGTNSAEQTAASTPNDSAGAAAAATPNTLPPSPSSPSVGSTTQPAAATTSNEPDRYGNSAAVNSAPDAPPQITTAPPATPSPQALAPANTASIPSAPANNGAPSNSIGVAPIVPPAQGSTTTNVSSNPPGPPAEAATNRPLPPPTTAGVPPASNVATTAPLPGPDASANAAPVPPLDANAAPVGKLKAPAGPAELGTYLGGKTVLLRFDDKTGAWYRIEPRSAVVAGERLLALPEFRPKIALLSELRLEMSGGTQVAMGGRQAQLEESAKNDDRQRASSEADIPTIELVYGRIVLTNPTKSDNRVRLKLGPSVGEAQLSRNATLAVEVERIHVPGQDPRQTPAPVECRLFAPFGGIVWKDGAGSKTVEKSSRWTESAAGATDLVADPSPPEWIEQEPVGKRSEQIYGAPKIESTLVSNIPVDTQLLELFQGSKQPEVKSLVARSSIHVGLFVPFVDALRDSEQRSNWKSHIETLRTAMALSPESANKVWQTLVDQRGRPAAADLYEMLCGYNADQIGHTPDQIKTGAVSKLIDWLEQDSLDYRVLAVQDLKEITGKQLMSNPAAQPAERSRNIRRWHTELEQGLKPISKPQ